jgi:RHS repeat-associated protein
MITTNSGQTVAVYEYDAYGRVESVKNALGSTITDPSHIGLLNPMRYRGYCYDNETGLYYLISRYYDPTTGRFVNADKPAHIIIKPHTAD